MRRALGTALIGAAILTAAPATVASAASEVPQRICQYDWRDGTWQIKQLIRCAARR